MVESATMRDESIFAIPVRFGWSVARVGYHWTRDTRGKRVICAVDAGSRGWSHLLNRSEYRPFEQRTGLFREFADLGTAEAPVLAFANRFGLLEEENNLELPSRSGPVQAHGETLEFWKSEIQALKFAVELWDAFCTGSRDEIAALDAKWAKQRVPLALRQKLHLGDEDAPIAAVDAIQDIADQKLQRHVATRLLAAGDLPKLRVFLQPRSLLGALWIQFAAAVDSRKTFKNCAQCGAPFELSRTPETGKRSDARFCSDRCRVAHYRQRMESARQLKSQGLSPVQIARELNAEIPTVRGWLKTGGADRVRTGRRG